MIVTETQAQTNGPFVCRPYCAVTYPNITKRTDSRPCDVVCGDSFHDGTFAFTIVNNISHECDDNGDMIMKEILCEMRLHAVRNLILET